MRIDFRIRRFSASAALFACAAAAALGAGGAVPPEAKLSASDAAAGDRLGSGLGVSGDTGVVGTGAPHAGRGAAYVFRRDGTAWTEEAILTAGDGADGDRFGDAAAIDGDTVVVGAPNANSMRGAAYVFTRSGTVWTQQAKLTTASAPRDRFGVAVAIDGDTVVVGASGVAGIAGAVYVFTRTADVWTQQAKLTASDAAAADGLGSAVALSGDTAIAGAYGVGAQEGAAYVFTRTGTAWSQEARLAATDGKLFGRALALDGETAAIGSAGEASYRGAVHVFTRSGTTWSEESVLTPADAVPYQYFGDTVAIDGDAVAVGATQKYVAEGAVHVFRRTGATWTRTARPAPADPAASTFFGFRVALAGDVLLATAFGADGDKGAAYAFDLGAPVAPPVGYCLASKAKAKISAKNGTKSTLTVSGTLDTGPGVPDFSGPARFDIGGFRVVVPAFVAKGRSLRHTEEGVSLKITPAKNGSSRAAFSVKLTGSLSIKVALDGELEFRFANDAHSLSGAAVLTAGTLRPRAVTEPSLTVLKAAAGVKGGGKDTLKLTLGFAGDGVVPPAAEDLTIAFGGTYTATLTGGWVRKGNSWVRSAKAPGIKKATVDYAKGTVTLVGSGLDLGAFAPGANPVVVTLTRGADSRTVAVRMVLAGTKLSY